MHRSLVGGFVQRLTVAFVAGHEVALLKVRIPPTAAGVSPGENAVVVLAASHGLALLDGPSATLLRDAMRGAPSPNQPRWRARMEGGRVVAMSRKGLEVAHAERTSIGVADRGPSLQLGDGTLGALEGTADVDLLAGGRTIVEALGARGMDNARSQLRQALRAALSRIERRIAAVTADLDRTVAADAMAERAQLFVATAASAPRGALEITATDWSTGEPKTVRMPLDPARGAAEQIGAMFKRARRLKDGARIARARLEGSETARSKLRAILAQLEAPAGDSGPHIEALTREAHEAAPRDFRQMPSIQASPSRPRAKQLPPPPYRAFAAASGARILLGRSGTHNDELTFHVARPHDLWLHVRGRAGAHVVVPLDRGSNCPSDVLIEAAHLAAHFSDARDEERVEVEYTPRKYVRKPHGGVAGLVLVSREKVLVLRRSESIVRRLLEREIER
jgi:hypothetical protein